jgi:tyrosine-protein kinase Etk/Wzc
MRICYQQSKQGKIDVPAEEISESDRPKTTVPHTAPLLLLLQLSLKWKKLIFTTAIIIVAASLAVALLLPSRYKATVVILPPQQSSSTGAALMAQLGNMGSMASMASSGLGIKNPNDLQVALLKSVPIEDAMAKRFHLQELYHCKYLSMARKHWERTTSAENGLKDGLIRISVTDTDPRRAEELVTGWVEEYRHMTATLAITEASQRRLFFEQQIDGARDGLTHAEEDFQQTEQRTGMIQIGSQDSAMIQSAARLRAQIDSKEVEIKGMREYDTEQNPDLKQTRQELASLEGQLSAIDVNNQSRSGDLAAPKGSVTQASLDYIRALREMKYRESIYELLMRQYEMARVDEAKQGAVVQVVDPGSIPDRPSSPHRALILLGGLVVALPLSLFLAWTIDAILIANSIHRSGSSASVFEEIWNGKLQ